MTETGGKTPPFQTTPSPSEFKEYLKIAKDLGVRAFKLGGLAVEFGPELDLGLGKPLSADPNQKTLGGWKRTADLDQDPELDTTWD